MEPTKEDFKKAVKVKTLRNKLYYTTTPMKGSGTETRARARLQKFWLADKSAYFHETAANPSRMLYAWLTEKGASDESMRRCGLQLFNEDDALKGADRIISGPRGWFDHTRVVCRRKDSHLFILSEPYNLSNGGLSQLAELDRLGFYVHITGESGWNPGRTLLILVSDSPPEWI